MKLCIKIYLKNIMPENRNRLFAYECAGSMRINNGLNNACSKNIHIVSIDRLAFSIADTDIGPAIWDVTIPDDATFTTDNMNIIVDKFIATNRRAWNELDDDVKNHIFETIKNNSDKFCSNFSGFYNILPNDHMRWIYHNLYNHINLFELFMCGGKCGLTTDEIQTIVDRIVTSTTDPNIYISKSNRRQWHYDRLFTIGLKLCNVPALFITKPMVIWAVKNNPPDVVHIPRKFKNREDLLDLAKNIPVVLKYLTSEEFSEDFYMECFKKDSTCIQFIPEKYTTEDMWETVLLKSKNKYILQFGDIMHSKYKTMEFCTKILSKDISLIQLFPDKCISGKIIDKITKNPSMIRQNLYRLVNLVDNDRIYPIICANPQYIYDIHRQENTKLTQKLCDDVFNTNPESARYIPVQFMTELMWLELVKYTTHDCYLKISNFMPVQYFTQELVNRVYPTNVSIVKRIPDELKTEEIAKYIFSQYPEYIKHLPEKFITHERCTDCVNMNSSNINYIPDRYKTKEMYDILVDTRPWLFKIVPKQNHTQKMCEKAVKLYEHNIYYISDEFKTLDMYENLTTHFNPRNIPPHIASERLIQKAEEFILRSLSNFKCGGRFITYDICVQTARKNKYYDFVPDFIQYVPHEFKTPELYEIALENNLVEYKQIPVNKRTAKIYNIQCMRHPKHIHNTPIQYITDEMIQNALTKNPLNIKYIPRKLQTVEMYRDITEKNIKTIKYIPGQFITLDMCRKAFNKSKNYAPHFTESMWIGLIGKFLL